MKQNNKGFSLVELIVALAIFAIAGMALVTFMLTTSNSYTRSNKDISLQAEQQLAVNQVRDLIIDSSNGIFFDDVSDVLKIYGQSKVDDSGNTTYPVTVISFTNGQLKFGTGDFASVDATTTVSDDDQKLFADHIESFHVNLDKVESEGQVTFKIVFKIDDKTLTANETVSLRNKLVVSTNQDEIWGTAPDAVNSFITKISIRRGMTLFDVGGTDEIGTNNTVATAVYSAEVTANEASEREYMVHWSISSVGDNPIPEGISYSELGGNEFKVTVPDSVGDGTEFVLRATSVDDQTKFAEITIKVTNHSVYPTNIDLTKSTNPNDTVEGNGYRSYKLIPRLTYSADPDGIVREETDPNYFDWEVYTVPLPAENPEGNAGEEGATGGEDEAQSTEKEPLPNGCSFDPATGIITLSSAANNRTIKVFVTAKERDMGGEKLTAEYTITETDIPGYTLEPALVINVDSNDELIRGGYVSATVDVVNVTAEEEAKYIYSWEIEGSYGKGTTRWDVLTNTEFKNISLATWDKDLYDKSDVDHEVDYNEKEYGDAKTINVTCNTDLNWSYNFEFILIARARDEKGNEIVTQRTVKIPKVELLLDEIARGPEDDALRDRTITSPILSYEDFYLKEYGNNPENYVSSEIPLSRQKGLYSTARRWFTMRLRGLDPSDEEWNDDYTFTQNYLFRNQIYAILNDKIVQKPTGKVLKAGSMCGFTATPYYWERLANRPVYMNYAVEMRDPASGNSVSSNPKQFVIVYEPYGKLISAGSEPETPGTGE